MELLRNNRNQQLLRLQTQQTKIDILTTQPVDPRVQVEINKPEGVPRTDPPRVGESLPTDNPYISSPSLIVYITNYPYYHIIYLKNTSPSVPFILLIIIHKL